MCIVVQFVHPSRPHVDYGGLAAAGPVVVHRLAEAETYGQAIMDEWRERPGAAGMVVLEQDIAVPHECWQELAAAVRHEPHLVHCANYLLYPASTKMNYAVWAHRVAGPDDRGLFVHGAALAPRRLLKFALGCTYLPARLLDAALARGFAAAYPCADDKLADLAIELHTPIVPLHAVVVHLHY